MLSRGTIYDSFKCQAGADVKGLRTVTPLQIAARNGLTDVLKPLLDAGADPNVLNEVSFVSTGVYFNHTMIDLHMWV